MNPQLEQLKVYLKARESALEASRPKRQYDGYLEGCWEGQCKEIEWALDFVLKMEKKDVG